MAEFHKDNRFYMQECQFGHCAIKLVRKDVFKDQKILMNYFKSNKNFMYIKILTLQCILLEEIMLKYWVILNVLVIKFNYFIIAIVVLFNFVGKMPQICYRPLDIAHILLVFTTPVQVMSLLIKGMSSRNNHLQFSILPLGGGRVKIQVSLRPDPGK